MLLLLWIDPLIGSLLFLGTFFLILYHSLVSHYLQIWLDKPLEIFDNKMKPNAKVSILVPCRNEKANLEKLIASLKNLKYPKELLEILLIDDHSSDGSFTDFDESCIQVLKLPQGLEGKKKALGYGVDICSGELIMTTDADCLVPRDWVTSVVDFYTKEKSKFIASPIHYTSSVDNTLSSFQILDNIITMALTGAGIFSKNYFLANGANMAFTPDTFNPKELGHQYSSGDDVFLINSVSKYYPNKVHFLKSKSAIVTTTTQENICKFIQQRIRWASKSRISSSNSLKGLYIITAFISLTMVLSLFIGTRAWVVFGILFFLKFFIDLSFLRKIEAFFDYRIRFFSFFKASLFYIPYILFMALVAIFPFTYTWKGRKTR